ncbi:MAG: hypothetical protein HY899_19130 [Deltaproteobacteria bacterium]|nr:hypothetical protein [Deltaproteobacteria bacterium]
MSVSGLRVGLQGRETLRGSGRSPRADEGTRERRRSGTAPAPRSAAFGVDPRLGGSSPALFQLLGFTMAGAGLLLALVFVLVFVR